jgi:hypothetical protein
LSAGGYDSYYGNPNFVDWQDPLWFRFVMLARWNPDTNLLAANAILL